MDTEKAIIRLIKTVVSSQKSSFFSEKYRGYDTETFTALPFLTQTDFLSTPFLERLYIDTHLQTKILTFRGEQTLVARSLNDIRLEKYGILCKRPLIFMNSLQDSLEKCYWYYEHGILPLTNESDIELTAYNASLYEIDAIVGTTETVMQVLNALSLRSYELAKIASILLLDTSFDTEPITEIVPHTVCTRRLALQEAGVVAHACTKDPGVFHADTSMYVEIISDQLVITKRFLLPTPIIRYATDIAVREIACPCGQVGFYLVPTTP